MFCPFLETSFPHRPPFKDTTLSSLFGKKLAKFRLISLLGSSSAAYWGFAGQVTKSEPPFGLTVDIAASIVTEAGIRPPPGSSAPLVATRRPT